MKLDMGKYIATIVYNEDQTTFGVFADSDYSAKDFKDFTTAIQASLVNEIQQSGKTDIYKIVYKYYKNNQKEIFKLFVKTIATIDYGNDKDLFNKLLKAISGKIVYNVEINNDPR